MNKHENNDNYKWIWAKSISIDLKNRAAFSYSTDSIKGFMKYVWDEARHQLVISFHHSKEDDGYRWVNVYEDDIDVFVVELEDEER